MPALCHSNGDNNVYYSIDYYSFTIPTEKPFEDGMFFNVQDQVLKTFISLFPEHLSTFSNVEDWTHESAARFYQHRLRHDVTKVALSYGKINAHILVELSGFACNQFDSRDLLLPLIEQTHQRTSRIDFAVDIHTTTDPKVFIDERGNKSFKSSGHKVSPTGRTYYIGGRTSERMARVYRYNEPHPRSHLLRVEAEYKGEAAKVAAGHLSTSGLQQSCLDAHHPFQWQHTDWQQDGIQSEKMPYKAYKPENASTVRWLYGDVITALRKAIKAELVDLDEWLKVLKGSPPKAD